MFDTSITPEKLNEFVPGTLMETISIEMTEVAEDHLKAKMPVDSRTHQPYGIVHGGAIAALAETLGSVASTMVVKNEKKCVGLELNVNHIRSVESGYVHGTCTPIHVGRRTHVWDIRIHNDEGKLTSAARLTVAVL